MKPQHSTFAIALLVSCLGIPNLALGDVKFDEVPQNDSSAEGAVGSLPALPPPSVVGVSNKMECNRSDQTWFTDANGVSSCRETGDLPFGPVTITRQFSLADVPAADLDPALSKLNDINQGLRDELKLLDHMFKGRRDAIAKMTENMIKRNSMLMTRIQKTKCVRAGRVWDDNAASCSSAAGSVADANAAVGSSEHSSDSGAEHVATGFASAGSFDAPVAPPPSGEPGEHGSVNLDRVRSPASAESIFSASACAGGNCKGARLNASGENTLSAPLGMGGGGVAKEHGTTSSAR